MDLKLKTAEHAGDCCGISCLYEFPNLSATGYSDKDRIEMIEDAIARRVSFNWNKFGVNGNYTPKTSHHCIEVVLIGHQVLAFEDALISVGFKEVFGFFNSNSGNQCHVYMMETNSKKGD